MHKTLFASSIGRLLLFFLLNIACRAKLSGLRKIFANRMKRVNKRKTKYTNDSIDIVCTIVCYSLLAVPVLSRYIMGLYLTFILHPFASFTFSTFIDIQSLSVYKTSFDLSLAKNYRYS